MDEKDFILSDYVELCYGIRVGDLAPTEREKVKNSFGFQFYCLEVSFREFKTNLKTYFEGLVKAIWQ